MNPAPPIPLDRLHPRPILGQSLGNISLLRLDQTGGGAPGNKRFKLRFNLARAREQGCRRIVSFGGAWSNHLHALAAAGAELGLATVGVVRGGENSTAMLEDARRLGMHIHRLSREEYRQRDSAAVRQRLAARYAPCLVLPEGGANREGLLGCMEIAGQIPVDIDWAAVVLAVGTGTTLAGVVAGLAGSVPVRGVSALKGASDLEARVEALLAAAGKAPRGEWAIDHRFHCGGFARVTPELQRFMLAFEQQQGIPLEPVYTGKMMYALHAMLSAGELASRRPVLAIHSGGLQGRRGYPWLPPL